MSTASRTLLIAFTLFCGALLYSQAITGDLAVDVTDPNGALVPGVKLELTNTGENTTLSGTTADTGGFTFGQLRPGSYRLKLSAAGFQEQQMNGITIQLGQRARVRVQLTLGKVSDSVTVSGEAATLLNAESSTQGQVIQSKPISELPFEWPELYTTCPIDHRLSAGRKRQFTGDKLDRTNGHYTFDWRVAGKRRELPAERY